MNGVAWKIRAAMPLHVAAAALLAWLAVNVFGDGMLGWGIALGLLMVVAVILGLLLESGLVKSMTMLPGSRAT